MSSNWGGDDQARTRTRRRGHERAFPSFGCYATSGSGIPFFELEFLVSTRWLKVVVLFSPMASDKKYVAIPVFVVSRFPVITLMGWSFPSAMIPDPHPMP